MRDKSIVFIGLLRLMRAMKCLQYTQLACLATVIFWIWNNVRHHHIPYTVLPLPITTQCDLTHSTLLERSTIGAARDSDSSLEFPRACNITLSSVSHWLVSNPILISRTELGAFSYSTHCLLELYPVLVCRAAVVLLSLEYVPGLPTHSHWFCPYPSSLPAAACNKSAYSPYTYTTLLMTLQETNN